MSPRYSVDIELIDNRTGTKVPIPAKIYKGLEEHNRNDFSEFNQKTFRIRKNQFGTRDPDSHWNWDLKELYNETQNGDFWVIECPLILKHGATLTQGMMLCCKSVSPRPGRVGIAEVKYLATAPHNRPTTQGFNKGTYSGVGSALMNVAYQQSKEWGFAGRVGLYALPQAENFYVKEGLNRYESFADPQGLVYFEGVL